MTPLQSILLGILQGITEFLPVSSSAHLEIIGNYFSVPNQSIVFDLTLHAGTLFSIIIYYRQFLLDEFASKNIITKFKLPDTYYKLFISTIPIILFYLIFKPYITSLFRSKYIIATTLSTGGIVLIWSKLFFKDNSKNIKDLSTKNAFYIGIFQSIALIRGVSRSGATIIGGGILKLTKSEAIKYAFLTGIFSIGLSTINLIYQMITTDITTDSYVILILGFLTSLITGLITINFFITFIKKFDFKFFGYYRIILAILIILYL